jgi:hypothetical protein
MKPLIFPGLEVCGKVPKLNVKLRIAILLFIF